LLNAFRRFKVKIRSKNKKGLEKFEKPVAWPEKEYI
jgi:hypothetical protein